MNRTAHVRKRLTGVLSAVATVLVVSGCGEAHSHLSGADGEGGLSGVGGCGGIYHVLLPGGQTKELGECSGSLHAARAPQLTVRVGDGISVRSWTDGGGNPVEKPPVLARGQSVRVVTRSTRDGLLVLEARTPGTSTLVLHSRLCVSATGHRATSCPVLHVTVTQ